MKDVCGYQNYYDYQKVVESNSSIINIYNKLQYNSTLITQELKCKYQLLIGNFDVNDKSYQLRIKIDQFQNQKLFIYEIPLSLNVSDIIDNKDKFGLKYTEKWVINNGNYNKNAVFGNGKRQSTFLILMELCWECKQNLKQNEFLEIKLGISA